MRPFLDDMLAQFARGRLVVARGGAFRVAELVGKPALLVPPAAAGDDHQKPNAEEMVRAGAAVLLNEWDLNIPSRLFLEALV